MKFIGKLDRIEDLIENEEEAELYCGADPFAFLGTNFSATDISKPRQVTDNPSYQKWVHENLSIFDKLKTVLGSPKLSTRFEKEFSDLSKDSQASILEDFQKAIDRNLRSPLYPDTKIVKDVSPAGQGCKVYELRTYRPLLRVYFNEQNGVAYLALIGDKSEQSADIKEACKILKSMTS
jgi:putative component of toxin-antitoxin plasmid stabilization module